jgi:type II secretory pathway pseudopilin PulG
MRGVTLLEVILAIAIFAFGMLALVQLQGNLTKASSDANQRTVATNIAEEVIENIRSYEDVELEYVVLAGTVLDGTVPRGGLNYQVSAEITDFWWDPSIEDFVSTEAQNPPAPPAGLSQAFADHKLLAITVAWNSSQEFYVDDENTEVLGDGRVTLYEIIPSSPPILGAKIAADINAPSGGPQVDYTPGEVPDIVRLALPDERFKESSTPEPDVIRTDESVETWFDVVTYNTINNATFLRREEFLVVTCECELVAGNSSNDERLGPTTWNGYDYTEGRNDLVKDYGVETVNASQSTYCGLCCRDHHDPANGAADDLYRPYSGRKHEHYGFDKKGDMLQAGPGDTYVEACRMIRDDGFMRVTHDLEQAGFYTFPEGYLESSTGSEAYGGFVVTEAVAYYNSVVKNGAAPAFPTSPPAIPASNSDTATTLPTTPSETKPLSTDWQQLRSRGVYLDYLTKEAVENIGSCFDGLDGTGCINPAVDTSNNDTVAMMYPFFDVQLTWLSRWNPADGYLGGPVMVTNEPLATNNAHDRGIASLGGEQTLPTSEIFATSHPGNLGVSGTGAIDPFYDDDTVEMTVHFAISDGIPDPVSGTVFTGSLSTEVNKAKPSDFILTPSTGVYCGQTDTHFTCLVTSGAIEPTVKLSNYSQNMALFGCSDNLGVMSNTTTETVFSLDPAGLGKTNAANIWVQRSMCLQQ